MKQEIDTLQEVNNVFKIPIFYNSKKRELNKTIINDLEMTKTYDASCNPINSFIFNTKPDNQFSAIISNECAKYYTTDTNYLTDMQQLLKTYKNIHKDKHNDIHYKNIIEIWNELKEMTVSKKSTIMWIGQG